MEIWNSIQSSLFLIILLCQFTSIKKEFRRSVDSNATDENMNKRGPSTEPCGTPEVT